MTYEIAIMRINSMGGVTRSKIVADDNETLLDMVARIVRAPDTLIEFTVIPQGGAT
jgi:hypothetical protein